MVGEIEEQKFDKVITPSQSIFSVGLKDILYYSDLLFLFVKRDFIAQFKQTILGPLWFFIQPVMTTIIFTVVFGNMAKISTNGLPPTLFYMAGIVVWNYFAEVLTKTSDTFITNQQIFGKVYFPRIIVPLSIVISNLLKFGVQFLLFACFYIYYAVFTDTIVDTNMAALLLPVLIIMMAGLGLGFGLTISSLTTKYRDLRFLIQFGVQLAMYASPIVYPLHVAGKYKMLILANPMTSIIETFKYGFLGQGEFSWFYLLYSFVFMIVILFIGISSFNKVEKSFIDTV